MRPITDVGAVPGTPGLAVLPVPDATAVVQRRVAELLANGSIEMSGRGAAGLAEASSALPAGTFVYVPALPGRPLAQTFDLLGAIRAAGLAPVPHLAARSFASRDELRGMLDIAVREHDVRRVMLIAGDSSAPLGPFGDSASVLRAGVLADAGVQEVGIAGYPEGHPSLSAGAIAAALAEKVHLARAQGLGVHVVTQFSFAPARIVEYCTALARTLPDVPVYVGMAGPTDPIALLRFAQRCGVSASMRALRTLGAGFAQLVNHTDPLEQLTLLARYCDSHAGCNITGAHLFSFGGFARTAHWINHTIERGLAPAAER